MTTHPQRSIWLADLLLAIGFGHSSSGGSAVLFVDGAARISLPNHYCLCALVQFSGQVRYIVAGVGVDAPALGRVSWRLSSRWRPRSCSSLSGVHVALGGAWERRTVVVAMTLRTLVWGWHSGHRLAPVGGRCAQSRASRAPLSSETHR